jgi:hypothetical protein
MAKKHKLSAHNVRSTPITPAAPQQAPAARDLDPGNADLPPFAAAVQLEPAKTATETVNVPAEQVAEPVMAPVLDVVAVVQSVPAGMGVAGASVAAGWQDMHKKALEFTQINIDHAFDFSSRLLAVRDITDLFAWQQEFLKSQSEALQSQTSELTILAARMAKESAKVPELVAKSLQDLAKPFAA